MKKMILFLLLILTAMMINSASFAEKDELSAPGNKLPDLGNFILSASGTQEGPERIESSTEMPTANSDLPNPTAGIISDTGGNAMDPLYLDFLMYLRDFITGTDREPTERYKDPGSDLFRRKMENSDLSNTGYALIDIDKNGTAELFLGDQQYGALFDVYTITDSQLTGVLHSGYKNIFTMNTDGTFTEDIMISAFSNASRYYSYENGELLHLMSLSIDYQVLSDDITMSIDPNASWYVSDQDNAVAIPISAAEADAIKNFYTPAEIRFTPLLTDTFPTWEPEEAVIPAKKNEPSGYEENTAKAAQSPCSPGDLITFGRYEQDNNKTNGPEPIEWKIIAQADSSADGFPIDENIVLLVSTKVLDAMAFNGAGTNSWDDSSLRKWLQRSFFYDAFTGPERSVIKEVTHKTSPLDTYFDRDTVFILSKEEIQRFLPNQSDRQFGATSYAVSRRVYLGGNGLACWWTRTYYSKGVAYNVWSNGDMEHGDNVTARDGGVLPAVWIDLDDWMKLP